MSEPTQQKLVDSALQLIVKQGLNGLSMNQICKSAGIAQPSFYHHYNSVQTLLADVRKKMLDTYLAPLQNNFRHILSQIQPPISSAAVRTASQKYITINFDVIADNLVLFRNIMADHNNPNSPGKGEIGKLLDDINQSWIAFIDKLGRESGITLQRQDIALYVDSLSAMTHSLVMGWAEKKYDKNTAINAIADLSESLINAYLRKNQHAI